MMRCSLLLSLLLGACRTATFAPATPQRALGSATSFRVKELRVERRADSSTLLVVTLEGAQPEAVRAVYLNSAYDEGCAGEPARPRLEGGRLVASWGVTDQAFFWGPTSIDLELPEADGRTGCARLPLASDAASGALALTGRREWFLATRVGIEGTSSHVTSSVLGVSLAAGTWLGPFRVSFGTGLGSATCDASVCKPKKETEPASGFTLPVDLEVEGFLMSRHTSAVSLALRPAFRLTWFDTAHEQRRRSAFTPALALKYWVTNEVPLSSFAKPQRKEGNGAAVELPLGLWQDLEGSQPLGWYTGVAMTLLFSVD